MLDEQFLTRLEHEVGRWQQEKLISAAQAKAVLARYGLVEAERQRSRLAMVLAFLGATLLGIGVIVFFAANWQEIPGWVKLALIFAIVIAAYHTGYYLRYQRKVYQGTGNALLFLGALLFGSAIFLIAQGFHINAHEPSLMVMWAVGVLPIGYLIGSRAMIALAVVSLGFALGWEMSFWLEGNQVFHFFGVYLMFGVLLYALAKLHATFKSTQSYKLPYGALGLCVIFGALFPLTFGILTEFSEWWTVTVMPTGALVRAAVLFAVAAAVTAATLTVQRRRYPTDVAETVALFALLFLGGALFVSVLRGPWCAIFFNLLLLSFAIGTIVVGYSQRESAWVNLGLFFFAIQVFVRYVDWFWELLPSSLFFIGAGLLLLLGGMALERTRRRVLRELREAGGG